MHWLLAHVECEGTSGLESLGSLCKMALAMPECLPENAPVNVMSMVEWSVTLGYKDKPDEKIVEKIDTIAQFVDQQWRSDKYGAMTNQTLLRILDEVLKENPSMVLAAFLNKVPGEIIKASVKDVVSLPVLYASMCMCMWGFFWLT